MDIKFIFPWINFAILLGVLFYYLRLPLRGFLETRHKKVRLEIQETSKLLSTTSKHFEEYKKKIQQLNVEIDTLKTEMRKIGEMEKEQLIRNAQAFSIRLKEDLKRSAEQELRKAKSELQKKTLELAFQVADQLVREQVQVADHVRLSQQCLADLRGMHG